MLPESARLSICTEATARLVLAAESLGSFADNDFVDARLQRRLRRAMRSGDPALFDNLVEGIRLRLVNPPHFAYVIGIPFDSNNSALVGLTSTFGAVVEPYRQPWSRVVRSIRPPLDKAVPGWGVLNERLHTDGTDWLRPNDLTCLQCVCPDAENGGSSLLMDMAQIRSEVLRKLGAAALTQLESKAIPWRIAEELGGGIANAPILAPNKMRWLRFTIDESISQSDARLSEEFENMLATTENVYEFGMEAGSLLIVHNKLCLHGRSGIPHPERSDRLLLRTKVLRSTVAGEIAPFQCQVLNY